MWQSARRHLTLVAEGGLRLPGDPEQVFRTAPLPDGVEVKLWEECGCDYRPPSVAGRPVPHKLDPAWTQWTEDPPREAGREAGKQSLRYALSDPRRSSDGGLLGPNFYRLAHFHSGDARHDAPGYPDLTIWSPRGIEVWELKRMGEVPTLPQAVHMTSLEPAGVVVRLVRPCCLLSGWVDEWLGELAGVDPVLSRWARSRRPPAAPAQASAIPAPVASAPRARRHLQVVRAGPGQVLDEPVVAGAGPAVGYRIPMPAAADRADVAALEEWLRAHGFPPSDVPWPIRIVTAGSLLLVWANTGEPAPARGMPLPRAWRMGTLVGHVPTDLIMQLGGAVVTAPTTPGVLGRLTEHTTTKK